VTQGFNGRLPRAFIRSFKLWTVFRTLLFNAIQNRNLYCVIEPERGFVNVTYG